MLVVLDDANPDHVESLLPGTAESAVLITTRQRLLGVDGARCLVLHELPPAEAGTLIERIIGPARAAAEPQAVADLARLCAYLPLAIRTAATRLASRPSWTVAAMAGALADRRRRLSILSADGGGDRLGPALTDGRLSAGQAAAYRQLAASGVRLLSLDAVSALLGADHETSRRLAERLVDLNLLRTPGPDRYCHRDLHYRYAQDVLRASQPREWADAVHRLTAMYLASLRDANEVVLGARSPGGRFRDADEARSWLDAEHANVVSLAADHAAPPLSDQATAATLRTLVSDGRADSADLRSGRWCRVDFCVAVECPYWHDPDRAGRSGGASVPVQRRPRQPHRRGREAREQGQP
jgi:hypothetical protein